MLNLEHKIENGRIKDKETEKIKLQYYNTYISAFNTLIRFNNGYSIKYDKADIGTFINNIDTEIKSNPDDTSGNIENE